MKPPNALKRIHLEGEKATLVNFVRLTLVFVGLALAGVNQFLKMTLFDFKIYTAPVIAMDGLYSQQLIYLGTAMIGIALLSFVKIKAKSPTFNISLLIVLLYSSLQGIFFYFGSINTFNSIMPFFVFLLISGAFLWFKLKWRTLIIIPYTYLIGAIIMTSLFSVTARVYNHINAENHYRHQGYHDSFFAAHPPCSGNSEVLFFKYNLIPVLEPCYFNRYLKDDERITLNKERVFDIFYGNIMAYDTFVLGGYDQNVKNYTPENAVKLYQIAVESIKKRQNEIDNSKEQPKINELRNVMLERELNFYQKSKKLSAKEFIEYLKNQKKKNEENSDSSSLGVWSEPLLRSVKKDFFNNKKSISFNHIEELHQRVLNSNKSTLFNNHTSKPEQRIKLYTPKQMVIVSKNNFYNTNMNPEAE